MTSTPPTPQAPALDAVRRRRAVRILLAEDNPVNQEAALSLLELAGLQADVANTGREAVAMAGATHYDLILMDVQMPVLDGVAATRELRAMPRTKGTPIIAMTTHADHTSRATCLAAGMNDHIAKPVDPTRLSAVLAQWLSRDAAPAASLPSPAQADAALPASPGLNTSRGLAFFAGDTQVYRRALQRFAELYGGGIAVLDGAIETLATGSEPLSANRTEALRRALHSVAGASTAIGAQALHRQATALEQQLGAALQHDRLVPDLAGFAQDLACLVADLRAQRGPSAVSRPQAGESPIA